MGMPQFDSSHGEAQRPERPAAQPPVDRNLLEKVLQETMAVVSVGPNELSALIDVGRRHAGQPLALEPVAVELVDAILRHRLPSINMQGPSRHEMLVQIAEAMLDDPRSEQRLKGLWARLTEAAS